MYFPVRTCPREGQHTGVWAKAFVNVVPPPPTSLWVKGMARTVESKRRSWSSVITSTTLGGGADAPQQLVRTATLRTDRADAALLEAAGILLGLEKDAACPI